MPTSFTLSDVTAEQVIDALVAAGFEVDSPLKVTRTVLDTFDGRLHEAGQQLALVEGRARELVLLGEPGTPPAHLGWVGDPPRLEGDLPPGPFGARVRRAIEERALLPVFEVAATVHEARRRDRRGKPVVSATVYEDISSATAGEAALPALVVEVVEAAGHERDDERTVARLARLEGHQHDGGFVETVAHAAGCSLEGHSRTPTVPLSAADDALDAFRAVLRNLLTTMLDNLPGTIADVDPEFLHDFRVAIRRTRSVVKEGKRVLPTDVREKFAAGFADLGGATGPARDLDVYVLGWADTLALIDVEVSTETAPVLAALEARRHSAHVAMCQVLESATTRQLLTDWQGWLEGVDGVSPHPGAVGPEVAKRIASAQETLLTHGRLITEESPPESLHDLRKDAKKLRYLLECFGSLLAPKARGAFVSQLKDLQDNLGEHQDREVQLSELRQLAHDLHEETRVDADMLLSVGRLIDALDRRRRQVREEFAERFAGYDTKKNRRALRALLAPIARP
jgi:CHAD domain-containing protein